MEIRARRVEAFLDPQRLAARELLGELGGDQELVGAALEDRQLVFDVDGHVGVRLSGREYAAERLMAAGLLREEHNTESDRTPVRRLRPAVGRFARIAARPRRPWR